MTDHSKAHGKFQGYIGKQIHETRAISKKETTLPREKFDTDHTLKCNHMVGKQVHNVYKI